MRSVNGLSFALEGCVDLGLGKCELILEIRELGFAEGVDDGGLALEAVDGLLEVTDLNLLHTKLLVGSGTISWRGHRGS